MLRLISCRLQANIPQRKSTLLHHIRLASSGGPKPKPGNVPPIASYANTHKKVPKPPLRSSIKERLTKGWVLTKGWFTRRWDWQSIERWTTRFAKGTAIAFLVFHVFTEHIYSIGNSYGVSMLPTLNSHGDLLFIDKYYRRGRGIEVGDLVSFRHPVREGENAVKRVLGLEGDFVLMNTPGKSSAMIQVPEGHCWVVGDNLKWSRDSRMFGPLPMALIAGKVTSRMISGWLPKFEHVSTFDRGLLDAPDDDFED